MLAVTETCALGMLDGSVYDQGDDFVAVDAVDRYDLVERFIYYFRIRVDGYDPSPEMDQDCVIVSAIRCYQR